MQRLRQRAIERGRILVLHPMAGIWGGEDALYRGVQEQLEPALRLAPAFRWLQSIAEAGHWVQYEDAAAFDRALAQALFEADPAPLPDRSPGSAKR